MVGRQQKFRYFLLRYYRLVRIGHLQSEFTIIGACSLPAKQEAFDSVEVLLGFDA